ncbi:serine/arginine-rich splicing factor 1 [Hydra vulgaris]|uniref:Serine/arginine-rich splicing factor 1-like n=2 Tax=Hydra vulgaris TaxID=6087 RepID=A0ABM4DQ84_HYDVU|nr:serine/arginine-rich splicing factor 1 [Hydra vulgaris]
MSRLIKSTSSECRVYVGNLPQFVKNRDIEDLFDKYGPIKAIDIHNRFDPAFAFLEFEDPRDASDAVYGKDGERFEGQRIRVQFPRNSAAGRERTESGSNNNGGGGYVRGRGRGPPIRRSENRVLVSGLPPTGSWQDLKDHMREAGEVLYADVYKDGTAVCEFANYEDMKWAVKYLDDSKFKSHENETTFVRVKRDGNSRSRSPARRSRSRSLRRSGSRSPRRRTRSLSPQPLNSRSRSRSRSPRRFSRSRSPIRRRSRSRSDSRR